MLRAAFIACTAAPLLFACASVEAAMSDASADSSVERISRPSEYAGYSAPRFDGHERSSFYVEVRDGTKLAVDLYRPTTNGQLTDEKLPVIWMHTPYNRRTYRGGETAANYPGKALQLVPYGYNVAVVDFRGVYASFGTNIAYNRGEWVDAAKWDSYDVTEWFAAQPWSTGKVGMWGCSATGGSQMQTLTTRPPSLKAVIPMSAEFDAYPFVQLGGVAVERVAPPSGGGTQDAIARRDALAVPVDGPDGQGLLEQAIASHADNIDSVGFVPFRDSVSPSTGETWWIKSSPATYPSELGKEDIGVFNVANWDEAGTRHGAFFTFNNIDDDYNKLLIGPATHCDWTTVEAETGFNFITEELRFYDYWLKDIENNVMDEPAVTYFTYNAAPGEEWSQSETWPLKEEVRTSFHLTAGALSPQAATAAEDIPAAFGPPTQTATVSIAPAEGGLDFETAPLAQPLEVTGHPVARIWIKTAAEDVDVTARLDDVAPDGSTRSYQMIGRLRATHREQQTPPFNYLGLPWRTHASGDVTPVERGQPMLLEFELLPMSYIFPAGHRVRLNLSFVEPGADGETATEIAVLSGPDHPSLIDLPVIP